VLPSPRPLQEATGHQTPGLATRAQHCGEVTTRSTLPSHILQHVGQSAGVTVTNLGEGGLLGRERVGEVGVGELDPAGSSSTPTARRWSVAASTRVVPMPHMGSATNPPGGQYSATSRWASSGSILPGWLLEPGR
jgi:hypothetical protein